MATTIHKIQQLAILGQEALDNHGVIRVNDLAKRFGKTPAGVMAWVRSAIRDDGWPIIPEGTSTRPTPDQVKSVADEWAAKIRDMAGTAEDVTE